MGGRWSQRVTGNLESTMSARPQEEERGRAVEVGVSNEDQGDLHARQQPQEAEPAEVTANSPAGAAVETLERLVALHARRIRLTQKAETPIQVHLPRDLQVLVQRPCRLEFIRDYQQAILGLAGAADETEPLVEWETFTRALLTTHRCIFRLSVHISAVQQPRGHFCQGFSLRDGSALISVEVSAFEDPWRDFMLRCLQYICRLRNPQQTSIHYFDHGSDPRPDDIINQIHAAVIVGIDLPEFNDNRLARILESTVDMPSLRQIAIYLSNAGAGPVVPWEVWLNLTHHGHSERRTFSFEVDGRLHSLMNCEDDETSGVTATLGIDSAVPLPRLVARRELTGTLVNRSRYRITLTHDASAYNYVVYVLPMVYRR